MPVHALRPGPPSEDLLEPYLDPGRVVEGRPWVLANMVATVDGRTSVGGRVGALSAGADAALFRDLRAVADVVLVGAQTVRAEGYGPVRLAPDRQAARTAAGWAEVPPVAVVSRSLDIDLDAPLFREAAVPTIVLTCRALPADRLAAVGAVAEVIVAGDDGVDLPVALHALGERGGQVVLCEGGPRLLGELVAADRLDELCLTIAPVLGGDPLPTTVLPDGTPLLHLRLAHVLGDEDGTLFLRYLRR